MQAPDHLVLACSSHQSPQPQRSIITTPIIVMQSEPNPREGPVEVAPAMTFSEALERDLEIPTESTTPAASTPTSSKTPRQKQHRRFRSSEFSIRHLETPSPKSSRAGSPTGYCIQRQHDKTPSPGNSPGVSPTTVRMQLQRTLSSNSVRPSILKGQFSMESGLERAFRPMFPTSHVSFVGVGNLQRSKTVHSTIPEDIVTSSTSGEAPDRVLPDNGFPWGETRVPTPTPTPKEHPPQKMQSVLSKIKLNAGRFETKSKVGARERPGSLSDKTEGSVKDGWLFRMLSSLTTQKRLRPLLSRRASAGTMVSRNEGSTPKGNPASPRRPNPSLSRLIERISTGSWADAEEACACGGGDSGGKMLGTEALSFLRTEMNRVNTPPLHELEIDGKKRGFFFDVSKPPGELTEREREVREKWRRETIDTRVLTGPPTISPRMEPALTIKMSQKGADPAQSTSKPTLLQRRTSSSQNSHRAARALEPPDYFRQRIATLADPTEFESDEVLVMDVPDHLPSSPLCPLHPKYRKREGDAKGLLCPVHGKGKKVITRQEGIDKALRDML